MKKSIRALLTATVFLLTISCNSTSNKVPQYTHAIIVMHPTVSNVKTILELIDTGVFPLPANCGILGVYHVKGSYDYSKTTEYLNTNGIKRVQLVSASAELSISNIYSKNGCTLLFDSLFRISKGIIFLGGPDLPPATYGRPTNLLTEITDLHRHYFELSFLFHLMGGSHNTLYRPLMDLNVNFPVLGICLGMQSINVATGGTMIQDIPTEKYGKQKVEEVLAMATHQQHRNYNTNFGVDDSVIWGHLHQISFEKGSLIDSLNASSVEPTVWSSHHQCVEELGKGIKPIAWSMDGQIVEALVHRNYPKVIAVQFHPEVPVLYKASEKLNRVPNQENKRSYIDLYAGEMGENFHRTFWKHFAKSISEFNWQNSVTP